MILDLYQGSYQGEPLRPGDRLLSFDAKPSIQARCDPPPNQPGRTRQARARRTRSTCATGALALLAALDVHTGTVFAATPETTGIKPFMDADRTRS